MREMMTPDQVAEYLQLTTDTVYRLIRGRQLAAVRIGKAYRVPKEDLETFLQTNSTRADVRSAMFRRVMEIGDRNPGLSGDDLLEELEEMDRQDSRRRRAG